MITFADFQKLDLRIARILQADAIEGSNKLLKLKVALGKEERQIIAGLACTHKAKDLIGKEVVIAANLEPREIFGFESQGMLLAAGEEEPVLLVPEKEIKPGSKIH